MNRFFLGVFVGVGIGMLPVAFALGDTKGGDYACLMVLVLYLWLALWGLVVLCIMGARRLVRWLRTRRIEPIPAAWVVVR